MKNKGTERKCGNCAIPHKMQVGEDLLCKYKGPVTADYFCSKHVFKETSLVVEKRATAKSKAGEREKKLTICLIAEGSYPFITGGVSSWIQMLIKSLPEFNFIIFSIMPEESSRGKYVYKLPENVIEVREVFMDTFLKEKGSWGKRMKLDNKAQKALVELFTGRDCEWEYIFKSLHKVHSISDFILSKSFFDILTSAYAEKYSQVSFLDFFWAVRSMVVPVFNLLNQSYPAADIYHSVSAGYGGLIGSISKFIYGKPFLMTEHGIYTREREEEIIKSTWIKGYFKDMWIDLFYNFSNCAYQYADRVITLYDKNRDIQLEIGCPPDKIRIVPNGVDLKEYKDFDIPKAEGERINIGAIIRCVPIKDIKTMLHAFALVKEEVRNADFYIMGPTDEDEEYYEECIDLVDHLGIKDVNFTGRVNIKEHIGKMDMLVLTSISEGQPLAILEGLACKRPFVATNVGSCSQLLLGENDEFGEAGIVVPVMNYVKISQAIIKLCKQPELRKTMGANGFARVSELYTLKGFIDSYRDLYKEIGGNN